MTLSLFRSPGQACCAQFGFIWCLLMVIPASWILIIQQRWSTLLLYIRAYFSVMELTDHLLTYGGAAIFLSCQVTLFPFPLPVHWKWITKFSLGSRGEKLRSSSWKAYPNTLFVIFCRAVSTSLPFSLILLLWLFSHLFISIFTHGYLFYSLG